MQPARAAHPEATRRVVGLALYVLLMLAGAAIFTLLFLVPPAFESHAAERYGATLVNEGLFQDGAALAGYVADLRALQQRPDDAPLAWKHGLGAAMTDPRLRLAEIRNWLEMQVLPRASARG